jgi:molybdopterin synthase catalytic subunit
MPEFTDESSTVQPPVSVRVRFYARYAELVGLEQTTLNVPRPATVGRAIALVREQVSNGGSLPVRPLVAVNEEHALPDRELAEGDLVALLPPLAGG